MLGARDVDWRDFGFGFSGENPQNRRYVFGSARTTPPTTFIQRDPPPYDFLPSAFPETIKKASGLISLRVTAAECCCFSRPKADRLRRAESVTQSESGSGSSGRLRESGISSSGGRRDIRNMTDKDVYDLWQASSCVRYPILPINYWGWPSRWSRAPSRVAKQYPVMLSICSKWTISVSISMWLPREGTRAWRMKKQKSVTSTVLFCN